MWHAWVKEAMESWKHSLLISRCLSGWNYLPVMVPAQLRNVNYCHWSSSLHIQLIRIVNMSSLQLETQEILLSYVYSMSLGGLEDQICPPPFKEMLNLTLDAKGRRVIWNSGQSCFLFDISYSHVRAGTDSSSPILSLLPWDRKEIILLFVLG